MYILYFSDEAMGNNPVYYPVKQLERTTERTRQVNMIQENERHNHKKKLLQVFQKHDYL